MLIDPIFVIYAYSEGLSANQIFILTSIESVLIILLEVPTGVISDLFGYKISMVFSCSLLYNIEYHDYDQSDIYKLYHM